MRKHTYILAAAMLVSGCSEWNRVGQLSMVSTRNVDSSKRYEALLRNVEGLGEMTKDDALQTAIDQAVHKHPGGEYMMNAIIYVKDNGKWVKVQGDVWGSPVAQGAATPTQTGSVAMKVNDRVIVKWNGKMMPGTLLGIRNDIGVVQFNAGSGWKVKEFPLSEITSGASGQ